MRAFAIIYVTYTIANAHICMKWNESIENFVVHEIATLPTIPANFYQ